MTWHVMLDLETLATDINAQIISIGAVKFNTQFVNPDCFYMNILMEGNSQFSVSPQTVSWWLNQEREAQQALLKDPKPIKEVLKAFQEWFKGAKEVWGNGVTFDNMILRNAFEKTQIKCPWHWRDDRCYRTVIGINKKRIEKEGIQFKRVGVHHNPVDDCLTQIEFLQKLGVME